MKLAWTEVAPPAQFEEDYRRRGGKNLRMFVASLGQSGTLRATTGIEPAGPRRKFIFHLSLSRSAWGGHEFPPTDPVDDEMAMAAVRYFFGHKPWEEFESSIVRHFFERRR